jgi:hypothetical protein
MDETNYSNEKIQQMFAQAFDVFSQCGLRGGMVQIKHETGEGDKGSFALYDEESKFSILNKFRSEKSNAAIKVFLIRTFSDKDYSAGQSYASWVDIQVSPTEREMQNSVWIATTTLEVLEKTEASRYNTLAHEMAHVLTRYGQHNGKDLENLMDIYQRRTNYILPEDCEQIRKNPFFTQLSANTN